MTREVGPGRLGVMFSNDFTEIMAHYWTVGRAVVEFGVQLLGVGSLAG